jgi:hypothetical protein
MPKLNSDRILLRLNPRPEFRLHRYLLPGLRILSLQMLY